MLDLVKNFRKHQSKIVEYISDRISTYYSSDCYNILSNRIRKLGDAVDMRYHDKKGAVALKNDWKSKVAMPLVREKYIVMKSTTLANFRGDPLVTVAPDGDTSRETAINAQNVLNQNFRHTKFRQKAFRDAVNYCSRYGAAVMIHNYRTTTKNRKVTRIGDFGRERVDMPTQHCNVWNMCLHPLQYFQNPLVADPDESDFCGWIQRRRLSDLIEDYMKYPDLYVKDNFKMVIENVKKTASDDGSYFRAGSITDWHRVGVDIRYWYGTINITGNEDDSTVYYAELVNEDIIRIQENPNDENLIPRSIYTFDRRLEHWWGNTPIENSIPFENYLKLIMSMRADMGMKMLRPLIFYDKSMGIDPADINNRAQNGGLVGIDYKGRSAREIFYNWQMQDMSSGSIDSLIREMKEADQRVSVKSDFMRSASSGGPQNKTLGAAMMMEEEGDTHKADYLEQFSFGLIDTARSDMTILQQQLPDYFAVRPKENMPQQQMHIGDILGTLLYRMDSALTKNKLTQATNLINTMTAIMNFRGTGDPSWMNVNMPQIIREWFNKIDLGIDTDEVYPAQQAQQLMGPMGAVGQQQSPVPALQDNLLTSGAINAGAIANAA